ncbi:MAG: hypothetical protein GX616_08630 [Planctomycetes bacterium]|nr:hypothetical protein [Planctomycetota bacterium]
MKVKISGVLAALALLAAGACCVLSGCALAGEEEIVPVAATSPGERFRGGEIPNAIPGNPPVDLQPPNTAADVEAILAGRNRVREVTRGGPQQNLGALASLGPVQPDPQRQWTVIAYLNGDCNLEGCILGDLNEMEAALPVPGVEIIALLDRSREFDTSDGDWADARVLRLGADADLKTVQSAVLSAPGEIDLGDPKTLATFVAAVMRTFPAKHYALLVSAHGGGWSTMICDDDTAGDPEGGEMSVRDTRMALAGALKSVGVAKIDLLSLDLCLMGQIEATTELKDVVEVIVFSEAVVPGHGQDYGKSIPLFASGNPREVGKSMVQSFGAACIDAGSRQATMSACDLTQMNAFAEALNRLLAQYQPAVANQWPSISRSMFFSESYQPRTDYRRGVNALASVDLMDMLRRMRKNVTGVSADAEFNAFEAQFAKYVFESYGGPGRRLSHGLAVYAPVRPDLVKPDYNKLRVGSTCEWPKLLSELHGVQQKRLAPPKVTGVRLLNRKGEQVSELSLAGGQSFEITVEGDHILWTIAEFVQRADQHNGWIVHSRAFVPDLGFDERRKQAAQEAAQLIDVLMPQYLDGKNVLKRPAVAIHYRLTNGQDVCPATLDYSDPGNVRHCSVPAIYTDAGVGQVPAELHLDTNSLRVVGVTGYAMLQNGRMVPFGIHPNPDAQITPYYVIQGDDGQRRHVPVGTLSYKRGLRAIPFFYEPGKYALIAEAESIGGNSTRKVFSFQVKGSERLSQWVQAGGRFTAKDLDGTWDWQIASTDPTGAQTYQPTGLKWTFKYDKEYPTQPDFTLAGGDVNVSGYVSVQTDYLPHLNVFTKVDPAKADPVAGAYLNYEEGYIRTDFYIAFLVPQGDQSVLILWDPTHEMMSRAVKAGATTLPAAAGSDLSGTWKNEAGTLKQVLTRNSYETYRKEKLVDRGMYVVNGNQIITRSQSGREDTETFSMPDANTLVIISPTGKQTVLKRQ